MLLQRETNLSSLHVCYDKTEIKYLPFLLVNNAGQHEVAINSCV